MNIESIIDNAINIINPDAESYFKNKKCTYTEFVRAIALSNNVVKELGCSATTLSKYNKDLFPNKSTKPLKYWLLSTTKFKLCKSCNNIKYRSEFYVNSSTGDQLNGYCKNCQSIQTSLTQSSRQAQYNSNKIRRTPKWANLEKIKEIYLNCPKGYHVDHIIPLKGIIVSGLHVESNLQYLDATSNIRKSNKFSL